MAQSPHLDLLLLELLAVEANHGYGLISALRARSGGHLDYPEGTIYPVLHRLEAAGLTESRMQVVGRRARRVYSLTEAGEARRATGRADWRAYVRAVEAVLSDRRDDIVAVST